MKISLRALTGILLIFSAAASAFDFPSSPDWESLSEIAYYHPENLWEYINGAADQFIDSGFQSCSVGEFKNQEVSFSIDIYDMAEPMNAYGVYMTESRGIEARFIIGSEAAVTLPSQCLMFKDKFYIKVYAFEGQLKTDLANHILTVIAEALPGEAVMPAMLGLLPHKNRIPGSEGFTRIGYLGLSELKNCLFASYSDKSEETFQYFFILPAVGENDKRIFESLPISWKTEEWSGAPLKIREIPYQGFAGIMRTEKGLVGISNSALPETVRQRLLELEMK
jgi:hypothetical protein